MKEQTQADTIYTKQIFAQIEGANGWSYDIQWQVAKVVV